MAIQARGLLFGFMLLEQERSLSLETRVFVDKDLFRKLRLQDRFVVTPVGPVTCPRFPT